MSYNVRLPNGVVISDIPDDIPKTEVRAKILQQFPELGAQEKRSIGRVGGDVLASLGVGVGSILQVPGQIGQLAGIVEPGREDEGIRGMGRRLEEFSQEAKSPTLVGKEAVRAQKLADTEGELAKFGTFLKQTITDPTLLTSFFAEQVPNLVGSMGSGLLARGSVNLLMKKATTKAEEAVRGETLGRVGVAGAVGGGALIQAADAGADTYERIFSELTAQGVGSEEANRRALTAGREAAISAAALTVGTSYLIPGGTTIERALVGRGLPREGLPGTRGFLFGASREALQEGIEEGGVRLTSNIAASRQIPGVDIFEGVGESAAAGALAGGLFGGPAGSITARRDARFQQQQELARAASEEGANLANAAQTAEIEARQAAYEAEQAETRRRIAAERFKDSQAYADLEAEVNKIKDRAQKARTKADNAYAELSAFTEALPDAQGLFLPTDSIAPDAEPVVKTKKGKPEALSVDQLPNVIPADKEGLRAFGRAFGIGPTALILREDGPLAGKNISDPNDAREVASVLSTYASGKPAKGAADKIEQFLRRSEFQPTQTRPVSVEDTADVRDTDTVAPAVDTAVGRPAGELGVGVADVGIGATAAPEGAAPGVSTPAATGLADIGTGATADLGGTATQPGAVNFLQWLADRGISPTDASQNWAALENQWAQESQAAQQQAAQQQAAQQQAAAVQPAGVVDPATGIATPTTTPEVTPEATTAPAPTATAETATTPATTTTNPIAETAEQTAQLSPGAQGTLTALIAELDAEVTAETEATVRPVSGKPKAKKQTAAERGMAEYEAEYAEALARDKYNTESSTLSPVTRERVTARQKILETIAGDLYVGEGKGRRARTVYKSLPAEDKAIVDRALEKYKAMERSGNAAMRRFDQMRADEAKLRADFGSDIASAIVGNIAGVKTPALTAAVFNGDIIGALKEIINGKGFKPLDRAIARRILENKTYTLPRIELVPRETIQDPNADGQYIPSTDTIQIVEGMVDSHTVLHEVVHGYLHAAIFDFEAGRIDNRSLRALRDVFNHVRNVAPQLAQMENTSYAMTSLTEFASEVMSNTELQAELAKIPYDNGNVFTKFVDFVMDLLGITDKNNALAAALMHGERTLNFGRSYQEAMNRGSIRTPMPPPAKVVRSRLQDISDRAGGIAPSPPPKRMFDTVRQATSKKGLGNLLNTFETRFFSFDAGLNNRIRDALKNDPDFNNVKDILLKSSTSQALHADGIATRFLEKGNVVYNPELRNYVAVEDSNNFISIINQLDAIAKQEGISYDLLKQYANQAFIAERINGMSKTDKDFYSNLTDEQVRAGLEFFDAIPQLREVQRTWNAVRQNAMDVAVDAGLYTRQEATELLNVMDYVPFFREDQVEAGAGPQAYGRGLLNFAKGRKIKGSDQKINDIFQNMESWTNYIISRSVKNKTANNMLEVAQQLFPDEVTEIRSDDQIRMNERQNVIDIYVDGNRKRFRFADPLFVDAFSSTASITTPLLNGFGAQASKIANVLRQSIVLVPLFSIAQLSMDSGSAMFTSGLKQPLSLPMEIMSEFTKTLMGRSATHQRLADLSATGIRDYMATVATWDKNLRSGLPQPSLGQRILKPFEKFAMSSDNAVRQGIYNRTLLETGGIRMADGTIRGGDEATAVARAFEVINYKRAGNNGVIQVLRQTIPFFGAYTQALNVMYKVATGRGIAPSQRNQALATLATTTAKVMALAFLYAALVSDSDEYREMDPAIRDSTLLIPGTMFRLPMRPDIFLFPKLTGEYAYQILTDDGFTDGVKMRRGMRDALVNAVTGPTPVPQFFRPIFEVGMNYDFFAGRPIIGRGLERLPTEQQYTASSSELAKIMGRSGLIAPVNADHLMRGFFGTAGGLTNMFISSAVRTTEGRSRPTMTISDELAAIPSVGRFITREYGAGARNDFYELRREVDTAVAGFNRLKTQGRLPEARQFLEQNKDLYALRTQVNRIQTQISDIRKRRMQIMEAPDSQISPEQKGEIIRNLNERERVILRQVYDLRRRAGF